VQVSRDVLTSHPKRRAQRYFRLGMRDGIFIGAWVVALLIAAAFIPQGVRPFVYLVGVILGLIALVNLPRRDERLYYLPVLKFKDWWLRRHGGVIWHEDQKRSKPVSPFRVVEFGNVGLIHTPTKNTVSIVFSALGSPTSALSMHEQKIRQDQLADTIRKMAASVKEPVQVSFIMLARPEDRHELSVALNNRAEPEVLWPSALDKPESERNDFDRRTLFLHKVQQSLSHVLEVSNDVDMAMVVSVKFTDAFRRALRQETMDTAEFNRQPIVRIMHAALPLLQEMVDGDMQVYDLNAIERYLRKARDVTGLQTFYEEVNRRHAANEQPLLNQHHPQHSIRVGKDHVEIDGTFGATLKIMGFPTENAEPYRAREFYWSTARWHAHTVIGETVHGGLEYNFLQAGSGMLGDVKDLTGVDQTGARADRHRRKTEDRLSEIDQSVYSQSYNVYVAVSAATLEELELETHAEMERLMAMGLSPVRVTGESSQYFAYLSATTGIDLL
jgi:hypothetical protein